MKRSEVLARARRAAELRPGCHYVLGAGGMKPDADVPWDARGCDCSGFYAWCLGVSRYHDTDGDGKKDWVETSNLVRATRNPRGLFRASVQPLPGDGIVYGDKSGRQGHVGVVSEVKDGKATRVIHCSKGNDKTFRRAIVETDAGIFYRNGAVVVRFTGTEEDELSDPGASGPSGDASPVEASSPDASRPLDADCVRPKGA